MMLYPLVQQPLHVIHDQFRNSRRSILSEIDYSTLYSIPKGFGGRIGILPRLRDGRFVINLSNRGLWSDFGGGVKAKEWHVNALERELEEEIPMWKSGMLSLLPTAKIYALEEFYPYSYRRSKITIRVMILCMIEIPDEWLETFQPSDEVLSIHCVSDLKSILESDQLNLGLQQLKKVYDSHQ